MLVADDQWHHVAGTRDAAANLKLYVDGLVVASCVQTAVPSSNNFQVLSFGCTHGAIGPPPGGIERAMGTFPFPSSDHRLVWVDIVLTEPNDMQ